MSEMTETVWWVVEAVIDGEWQEYQRLDSREAAESRGADLMNWNPGRLVRLAKVTETKRYEKVLL